MFNDLSVNAFVLGFQLDPGLFVVGVGDTGVGRADRGTLMLVVHGHTLGAFGGIDLCGALKAQCVSGSRSNDESIISQLADW